MPGRLLYWVAGLLLSLITMTFAQEPAGRVLVDDPLQGATAGTLTGGELTPDGFRPGKGAGHVLYRLEETVSEGYAEFEFRGMDPAKVPADADHGFFAMYDGRGIEEPARYFDDFKGNFNRWNVHWRQNRGEIKAVVSCPAPTPDRAQAARAVFPDSRDWSVEPAGKPFPFDPTAWHKMRIEWGGRTFRVSIDGTEVWAASGPYDYAPADHRVWLGSAPAILGEKVKYACTLEEMTYRNFRLVAFPPGSRVAQGAPALPLEPTTARRPPENAPMASARTDEENRLPADLVHFASPWTSPFSVDKQYRHQLVNRDGQYLFILNKTAWAYFACKDPEGYLDRARAQGITVIRVALEGRPYWSALGMEMWPWGGTRQAPDYTSLNEPYWQEVERRIRLAGERGIGIDLCLYFTLRPEAQQTEEQRLYWQTALERLGKYANLMTWEIHNEHLDNEQFQDAAGTFFHENDPYRRPVCSSDGTTDDAAWPTKPWMDLAINHTCTSSTEKHGLKDWYLALARNTRSYGKPAWCNESGRENRHKNDDGIHRRKQGWLWTAAGCFWTHHSWDGCEGIDDAAYKAPGEEFLAPLSNFWQGVEFWTLNPNQTVLTFPGDAVSAVLASADRSLAVGYVCTEKTGEPVTAAKAVVRLPDGAYRIEFVNPATGEGLGAVDHVSDGLHRPVEVPLPDFTDDLAVKIVRIRAEERTLVPGTR